MAQSIWPKSSSVRVAQSLEAHSVIALAIGGLIYILALTGTLSIFNHEIQRWEQPGAPEMSTISPEAAAKAASTVFLSEETPSSHLYINFPQADLPRTVITTDTQAFFATAEGELAGPEHFPWTEFLLDLHYYLHLPHTFGMIFVSALGALLIGLSLSGFLAHPRIFRDAFTFRRGAGRLTLADLHNRLSVWTAPFHISNALTGAILGLAGPLAFVIAAASFDGDTSKVFSPIFGSEPEANEALAELANVAGPLAYMAETHQNLIPTNLILHDPGTEGQHFSIIAQHSDRLVFGEYYNFDASGSFLGTTGIADGTIGQQIAGSVYNVHFGNWGGIPVKLAYLIFGLALCTITASGLNVYFARRREQGRAAPRLEAGWAGVVWGAPAALALTLLASVTGLLEGTWLVTAFWLTLLIVIVASVTSGNKQRYNKAMRLVTALLLVLAVLSHGILNWESLGSQAVLVVSLATLFTSAAFYISTVQRKLSETKDQVAPLSR